MEEHLQKKNSLISVIVPVYKVEDYLRDCVDSILSQTYRDFELILVDDGSPDRCGEICNEYAAQDPRVRVIHQENQGLSGARNAGMDIARGEYLSFVDSDDMVSQDYLSVLLEALTEANADFSACRLAMVKDNESNSVIRALKAKKPNMKLFSGKEACVMIFDGRPEVTVNACGKLFRVALIGDSRFPVGRLHEDQAFIPKICYQARIVSSVHAGLYYYRDRDGSITNERFTAKRYDDLWALDQCIDFFQQKNETEILAAAQKKRKRLLCGYSILARASGAEVPEEYRVRPLPALLYLRKNVQPGKYQYYLARVSPKLAKLYEYERKLRQTLKRK